MVFVVDDDEGVRESVRWLLESVNLEVEVFDDAQTFMRGFRDDQPGVVLLDIRMPGASGLEVQEWMREQGVETPVVILTGHADVPAAVRAMKGGALDFIEKPYNAQALIETVQRAIQEDQQRRESGSWRSELRGRIERLTSREGQVAKLVAKGLSNKAIARKLDLSPKTVEVHRARVMDKMEAGSTAQLVQMLVTAEWTEEAD
ncbi:MAG TPA: response regulator [Gammaproteobacteria bacterium]|nr:response regulator [Gammaproteobacteria bacterium]